MAAYAVLDLSAKAYEAKIIITAKTKRHLRHRNLVIATGPAWQVTICVHIELTQMTQNNDKDGQEARTSTTTVTIY